MFLKSEQDLSVSHGITIFHLSQLTILLFNLRLIQFRGAVTTRTVTGRIIHFEVIMSGVLLQISSRRRIARPKLDNSFEIQIYFKMTNSEKRAYRNAGTVTREDHIKRRRR